MNTYLKNTNTTEISWAKRTKNVTKEKLCKQHSICQKLLKCSTIQFIIVICLVVVVLNSFTSEFLYFVAVANLLISLIYGSHENSNKNGKAGEAKIGAFMSHLRWPNNPQATAIPKYRKLPKLNITKLM
ncbi:conserved hypothetical protein [Trichinella spiralis]|uniref:hypothetical protein n=1 Tax=Trichinella spiralis TaxID=6334 RepID=UPI0001EFD7A1|nr:conserved hypothetical protein [Trichinella spiralis]